MIFLHHFLHILKELGKKGIQRLVKTYGVEDDETFKKFGHKKDFTRDLYNNVYCGDVAEVIHIFPTKEYMVGTTYNDGSFRFNQLEKMVKYFAQLTTASLWRIIVTRIP